MNALASLFVGRPLTILAVAVLWLVGWFAARALGAPPGPRGMRAILIAAVAWGLYATWEWLVQARTPEADIRVDLLVIWPLLALISLWALVRAFRE